MSWFDFNDPTYQGPPKAEATNDQMAYLMGLMQQQKNSQMQGYGQAQHYQQGQAGISAMSVQQALSHMAAPVHVADPVQVAETNKAAYEAQMREAQARILAHTSQTEAALAEAEKHRAIEAINDAKRDRVRKEGAEFIINYAFGRELPHGWKHPSTLDMLREGELAVPRGRDITIPRSSIAGQIPLALLSLGDALSGHPLLAIAPAIIGFAWMGMQGRRVRIPL